MLVADGTWVVPIPFGEEGIAHTLCYLIEDASGAVHVVDPGSDGPEQFAALVAGLAAAGRTADDVASVIVTHLHTDHLDLAVRLHRETGAPLVVHEVERRGIVTNGRALADRLPLDEWGVPAERRAELRPPERVPIDPAVVIVGVRDGEVLDIPGRRIEAVWTPGHTAGHLCLHAPEEGLLVTGDHVLPGIRPGFGLGAPSDGNPLVEYLASLDRVEALGDPLVLPGHEHVFRGLGARCRELRSYHERRAATVAAVLRERPDASLWSIVSSTSRTPLSGTRLRLALMQTAWHLARLTP